MSEPHIDALVRQIDEWKDEASYYQAEARKLRAVLQEIWELTDVDSNTVPSAARLSAIVRAALNEETK